ncbi:hypothetical protein [Aurantivibrio plasticivorans]
MTSYKNKPSKPVNETALWHAYDWFKGELDDDPALINHNVSASTSLSSQHSALQSLSQNHRASLKQFESSMSSAINKIK